ncbi:hypothetical protein PSPO01_08966 [Paraphaeosphaeria sporulosa]
MPDSKLSSSIAIVGAGDVGATIAFSLIMNPVAGDILMVDPKEEVRDAQIQDLSDATFHGDTSTQIRAGTHKEAGQCDNIVFTPFAKHTILLLVANPVDVITYFAQKYSNLPKSQVIGSGTFLDSARLRGVLAAKAEVSASSIDAYVLGEHGESQFVAWSAASIGGVPLEQTLLPNTKLDKAAIAEDTKNKATSIIENKGATNYGIGAVTASICKSILSDQRNIRPVSHYQEDLGVCLSIPAVIGRQGLVRTIEVGLNEEEKTKLKKSVEALKEIINA